MRRLTIRGAAVRMAWAIAGLLALTCAPALGASATSETASSDYSSYMPVVNAPLPPCDPSAIAQLRGAASWQGEFSVSFSGSASGSWPNGDTEAVSVGRTMRFQTMSLVKNFDSATFVRWGMPARIDTGEFTANDSDVRTFAIGGSSTKTAQFTAAATADVVSILLYPDQCKLRFLLDGQAIGPVSSPTGGDTSFYFCATLDVPSPRAGEQASSSTAPLYLSSADVTAYDVARRAGVSCRVGGGDPTIDPDPFMPALASMLDGGTTSGPRSRGVSPLGDALVGYRFAPQP